MLFNLKHSRLQRSQSPIIILNHLRIGMHQICISCAGVEVNRLGDERANRVGLGPRGARTLGSLVEQVVLQAANHSAAVPWTLYVASDSPAVRTSAVQHARRMGAHAVHSIGTVGHNVG